MLRFVYSTPVTLSKDAPVEPGWYILYGKVQNDAGNTLATIAGEFVETLWIDGILSIYCVGELGAIPVKNVNATTWIGPFGMLDQDGMFIKKIGEEWN